MLKLASLAAAIVGLLAVAAGAADARTAQQARASYIVVLKAGTGDPAAVAAEHAQRFGGNVSHVFSYALRGFSLTIPEAAVAALQRDSRVEFVEPDGEVTADTVQSGATWGLDRVDQRNLPLVAVRVLNCNGSGTTSGVVAGIDWVTANHAAGQPAVANMSLGGGASFALDSAVRNSIADDVSYAIAAGKGNIFGVAQNACNTSPARVTEAMTVSATDRTDTKASWANYGTCVDWFAPGVGITSAWYSSDTATNTISGTSMATPHTAGVAALYLQGNPGASPATVRSVLYSASTKGVVKSPGSGSPNALLFTNY